MTGSRDDNGSGQSLGGNENIVGGMRLSKHETDRLQRRDYREGYVQLSMLLVKASFSPGRESLDQSHRGSYCHCLERLLLLGFS